MPTLDEREKRSIEGFGIAYLEAAFFGIPSIASDVGGTKEAVLHNKTGIIINNIEDIYQSIHDLLINPNQRKKLGNSARKRALEDFNWDIVTKKYLDAIKN
jgi:phosphatidylinositol alpha-1,6-mannosyltransferase